MTSFRLIQIAHNVANMRFHSAALQYGPSPMDRQKSSNDVNSGRRTPTNRQTAWEMGHNTKRCSQFSRLAPTQYAVPCRFRGHALSKRSRHQSLSKKEPDKDPNLHRSAAFPHPTPETQEKRVFRSHSLSESTINCSNIKRLAAPTPLVRARGRSLISQ